MHSNLVVWILLLFYMAILVLRLVRQEGIVKEKDDLSPEDKSDAKNINIAVIVLGVLSFIWLFQLDGKTNAVSLLKWGSFTVSLVILIVDGLTLTSKIDDQYNLLLHIFLAIVIIGVAIYGTPGLVIEEAKRLRKMVTDRVSRLKNKFVRTPGTTRTQTLNRSGPSVRPRSLRGL